MELKKKLRKKCEEIVWRDYNKVLIGMENSIREERIIPDGSNKKGVGIGPDTLSLLSQIKLLLLFVSLDIAMKMELKKNTTFRTLLEPPVCENP